MMGGTLLLGHRLSVLHQHFESASPGPQRKRDVPPKTCTMFANHTVNKSVCQFVPDSFAITIGSAAPSANLCVFVIGTAPGPERICTVVYCKFVQRCKLA